MRYGRVIKGFFNTRPNRFIAKVEVNGREETVHVKNTGRCRELLVPGCAVYLSVSDNPLRKTAYDLIAVEKKREGETPLLINIDSAAPNEAVAEWLPRCGLFGKDAVFRREVSYGSSRFDFQISEGDRISYLEVKGVTLESDGVLMFPDAPTERGVNHILELCELKKLGFGAYAVFVIQMKGAKYFTPNSSTHKEFAVALSEAKKEGVEILAFECNVSENEMSIGDQVAIKL